MFLKHFKSHRRSALYVRISGSVGGVVWSKNLSFRLEFAGGAFLLLVFFVFVCHTVLSVPCSLVVTCWERADLTLLYVMLIVF